jgi:hypothetical protein
MLCASVLVKSGLETQIMAVRDLLHWSCDTLLSAIVGTNLADKWRSLSRYSSLTDINVNWLANAYLLNTLFSNFGTSLHAIKLKQRFDWDCTVNLRGTCITIQTKARRTFQDILQRLEWGERVALTAVSNLAGGQSGQFQFFSHDYI